MTDPYPLLGDLPGELPTEAMLLPHGHLKGCGQHSGKVWLWTGLSLLRCKLISIFMPREANRTAETRKEIALLRRGIAYHSAVSCRAGTEAYIQIIGPHTELCDLAQVTILGLTFLICEMGLIMPDFLTLHEIGGG